MSLFLFVFLYHLPITILLPGIIRKPLLIMGLLLFLSGVVLINVKYTLVFITAVSVETLFYYFSWSAKLSAGSYLFPAFISAEFLTCAILLLDHKVSISKSFLTYFLIITFLTSLTTILGVLKYPTAVRTLGQVSNDYNSYWQRLYRTMNIASWGLLFGMAFSSGTILYVFKKKKRILVLATLVVTIFCVILSQLMFAILMMGILLLVGLINREKKGILIRIIPIVILALVFWIVREQVLSWLYTLVRGSKFSMLSLRIKNLYDLLVNKDTTGDAGARFELYAMSLTSFLRYPLGRFFYGTENVLNEIGFHSEFCDLIGTLGVAGILVIFLAAFVICRRIKVFNSIYNKRFYLSMVGIFALMFLINPIIPHPQIWLCALVVPLVAIDEKGEEWHRI